MAKLNRGVLKLTWFKSLLSFRVLVKSFNYVIVVLMWKYIARHTRTPRCRLSLILYCSSCSHLLAVTSFGKQQCYLKLRDACCSSSKQYFKTQAARPVTNRAGIIQHLEIGSLLSSQSPHRHGVSFLYLSMIKCMPFIHLYHIFYMFSTFFSQFIHFSCE